MNEYEKEFLLCCVSSVYNNVVLRLQQRRLRIINRTKVPKDMLI